MKSVYEGVTCIATLVLLLASGGIATAQEQIPFDSDRWDITTQQHLLLEYQEQQALYLYDGRAMLSDVSLKNGIIEFDVAISGERGFTGVRWRVADPDNFEEFYIRPHQSGNPDANQYTPLYSTGCPGGSCTTARDMALR